MPNRSKPEKPATEISLIKKISKDAEQVSNYLERLDHNPKIYCHRARQRLKQIRAGIQLLRGSSRRDQLRSQIRHCKFVAALISECRDTQVMIDTFDHLLSSSLNHLPALRSSIRRQILKLKRQQEAHTLKDVRESKSAFEHLQSLNRDLAGMKASDINQPLIVENLTRTYKRGRKTFLHLTNKSDSEDFHRMRKELKCLQFQLAAVQNIAGVNFGSLISDLKILGNKLGIEHDLAVFLSKSAELKLDFGKARSTIEKTIYAQQRRYRSVCIKLAGDFFSNRPKTFKEELRLNW
jgi:CHAD domain-containing protein